MGVPVLVCTICYYPFHGSSKSISKCSQIISASTYFMRTLFLSPHVIFLYILLEKLLSFSPNILLRVNHFRSVTEMDPERSKERKVEPNWSPGFARNYQAASSLIGEVRMPDARSPTEFCG